jgi:hypothetical protein
MRENLGSKRDDADTPSVRILTGSPRFDKPGRGVWLQDEVENFLFRCVVNPMGEGELSFHPKYGMGTCRDFFEPEYTQPHLSYGDLVEVGIVRKLHLCTWRHNPE